MPRFNNQGQSEVKAASLRKKAKILLKLERKALNKKEKKSVTDAVGKMNAMFTAIIVCAAVKQQVPTTML